SSPYSGPRPTNLKPHSDWTIEWVPLKWANASDEWVRLLVAEVIATGRPVGTALVDKAYLLFRQEKSLDERELPAVPLLNIEARQDESAPSLSLTRLSEVRGVNALVEGAEIEPHDGLTILYGENGTGKTGYSRIFKALANSRTADTILGNIDADTVEAQSAKLDFKLGDTAQTLNWTGELGVPPFTRMSIFDSPAVRTHVDEDLDYGLFLIQSASRCCARPPEWMSDRKM
ncbi:hypothetical protein QEN44_22820, partial [Gordonia alkanivorans]|nr:hypothetical protein [Gordonia alkanivorans]